jgi:hypothetical protein
MFFTHTICSILKDYFGYRKKHNIFHHFLILSQTRYLLKESWFNAYTSACYKNTSTITIQKTWFLFSFLLTTYKTEHDHFKDNYFLYMNILYTNYQVKHSITKCLVPATYYFPIKKSCLFIFTFYLVLRQTLTESLQLMFIETFLYLNNV